MSTPYRNLFGHDDNSVTNLALAEPSMGSRGMWNGGSEADLPPCGSPVAVRARESIATDLHVGDSKQVRPVTPKEFTKFINAAVTFHQRDLHAKGLVRQIQVTQHTPQLVESRRSQVLSCTESPKAEIVTPIRGNGRCCRNVSVASKTQFLDISATTHLVPQSYMSKNLTPHWASKNTHHETGKEGRESGIRRERVCWNQAAHEILCKLRPELAQIPANNVRFSEPSNINTP